MGRRDCVAPILPFKTRRQMKWQYSPRLALTIQVSDNVIDK